MFNQHWARWRGLGDTPRQVQELISGASLGAKEKFLSFNRIQTRAVTGLLTGHNALRRRLHLLGLVDSPMCRRCGMEEETLAYILCECEALASSRYVHLGSLFLELQDIQGKAWGPFVTSVRSRGSHDMTCGKKGLSKRPRCIRIRWGPVPMCSLSI